MLVFAFSLLFLAACATPQQTLAESANGQVEVRDFESAPEGFTRAEVLGVAITPEGAAVVMLGSQEREAVLPIFIDPVQAMTIELRLQRQPFQRPLTHDLLENMLEELGGEIAAVHVNALHESTFYATIYLIRGGQEVIEIDARPSDAIALAVGNGIPIFVNEEVLEAGGFTEEELQQPPPRDPNQPAPPEEPGGPTTI